MVAQSAEPASSAACFRQRNKIKKGWAELAAGAPAPLRYSHLPRLAIQAIPGLLAPAQGTCERAQWPDSRVPEPKSQQINRLLVSSGCQLRRDSIGGRPARGGFGRVAQASDGGDAPGGAPGKIPLSFLPRSASVAAPQLARTATALPPCAGTNRRDGLRPWAGPSNKRRA